MAAHKLPRLSKSLLDTPQLITESKFREIAEVLENRDSAIIKAAMLDSGLEGGDSLEDRPVWRWGEGIGVLDVEGSLTYKPTGWEALCGSGTNYVGLMEQIDSLAAQNIKTVVMQLDSPGGQAFRCFSTSSYIRKIADANDMKIIGYVNGLACSGGMALASICDELISNPDSEIGSIGVVISLTSTAKRDEKEGVKREFITAGKSKVPFGEDGEFKEEYKADLQAKINKTYETFVEHVATFRGLDAQIVRDTEAKVFDAEDALSLGLIDKIMEEDEFKEYIGANFKPVTASPPVTTQTPVAKATNTIQKETPLMSDVNITAEQLAEMQTALANLQAESAAKDEQLASFLAKEQASAVEAMTAKMDAIPFVAAMENKGSLVDFLMSANEEQSALMNSVIDAANLENAKVLEEAASQMAEKEIELNAAKEEAAEAKAEAEAVKAEFGTQDSIEGDVEGKDVAASATSGSARTAALAAKVKAKLANK